MYRELAASGPSEKTIHNVHIALRKALQDALEDGLVRKNVADRAYAKPKDRPEMLVWSADELFDFLTFSAHDPDHAVYQLAVASGMRRGELLGLRWRNVDIDGGRLTVKQQWTRQGSALGFGPPKSAKSIRSIDVDPETVDVLRNRQDGQRFHKRAWGKAYRSDLDLVRSAPQTVLKTAELMSGAVRQRTLPFSRKPRWSAIVRHCPTRSACLAVILAVSGPF